MPSASDPLLGTGKTLAGPTAVALVTPKHWVIGVLVNNQWSIAGDPNRKSVNAFLAQPFVNYNIPNGHGWYLVSSPIITADWTAPSGQQWTVPLGGGVGRVFRVSGQGYSAAIQAFYNVVHPDNDANWQFRAYLALLFPKEGSPQQVAIVGVEDTFSIGSRAQRVRRQGWSFRVTRHRRRSTGRIRHTDGRLAGVLERERLWRVRCPRPTLGLQRVADLRDLASRPDVVHDENTNVPQAVAPALDCVRTVAHRRRSHALAQDGLRVGFAGRRLKSILLI